MDLPSSRRFQIFCSKLLRTSAASGASASAAFAALRAAWFGRRSNATTIPARTTAVFILLFFIQILSSLKSADYQLNLSPNWIRLESVLVEVISPAVAGTPPCRSKSTIFGVSKLAWLRALKNSARNCVFSLSLILKFLKREKSRFESPGAVSVLRPRFPNVYWAGKEKHWVLI